MAVKKSIYLDFLKDVLVPFINQHHSNRYSKFRPDLASSHYANEVVDYLRCEKINFVGKYENPANVPEAIEDFWSILNGKVSEDGWKAENLTKERIRVCLRHIDQNLLNSTSNRLNKIRMNNFIEKR